MPRWWFIRRLFVATLLGLTCVYAEASITAGSLQIVGTAYGAVAGRAMDPSGTALPQVTIRLSSAALMQPRVAVTADDGSYRFVALPPGDYALTFERSGFRRWCGIC